MVCKAQKFTLFIVCNLSTDPYYGVDDMAVLPQLKDDTYRIEAELGAGSGGVVYKAWHKRLQKYVVLKRIRDNSKLAQLGLTRSETDILKNLKHPNLPQVYDFLDEPSGIYTVMEFIPGKSFARLLSEGERFSQPQAVRWAGDLSSALAYLHSQSPPVLHSDIKPDNIMLTPNGDICLIDFNISLVLDRKDVSAIGLSPGYAPPEQCAGRQCCGYAPLEQYAEGQGYGHTPLEQYAEGQGCGHTPPEQHDVETQLPVEWPSIQLPFALPPVQLPDLTPPYTQIQSETSIDARSDIYSLGATLYHIATGVKPPIAIGEAKPLNYDAKPLNYEAKPLNYEAKPLNYDAKSLNFDVKPLNFDTKISSFDVKALSSDVKPLSGAFIYIIERCMEHDPANRFQTASSLHNAILNIHKHDERWKAAQFTKALTAVVLSIAFVVFASLTLLGARVMAQEKERLYYAAIFEIANEGDAQMAYNNASDLYYDRIDHYHAMALRLWNDGEFDACRLYIEGVLGDIARFQAAAEAQRLYGEIFYILGNCYYNQPGLANLNSAKGNFEIALKYITDNPLCYRDYAITLARTGHMQEAEKTLEIARMSNLDNDSLNLLNGEVAYVKCDYDNALQYFDAVIKQTSDDNMRYRAYNALDDIYKLLGQHESSTIMLEEAINRNRIPLTRAVEMTERLADAYMKCGDYYAAVGLLEQLAERGAPQFHIMESLAVLLHNIGELDRAMQVLCQMGTAFPQDYRVPMRKAFLEADKQSGNAYESRDYSEAEQYYSTAVTQYKARKTVGESDPEMQQLEVLFGRLWENGWLEASK